MRTRILPQIFIACSLISSGKIYAEENCCKIETESCQIPNNCKLNPAYNAPARIAVDNCVDVFVTSSFTYWNPTQENMELGILASSDLLYKANGKVENLDPGYKPGFKVGLGMNLDRDDWDLYSEYTWFRGSFHEAKSAHSPGFSIFPCFEVPSLSSTSFLRAKEKWDLHMDLIDLNLERRHFVGKKLMFHPFFGARWARILQKVQAAYYEEYLDEFVFTNLFVTKRTNSWGIGPRTGVTLDWMLGCGFNMFGKAAVDMLFTQYTKLNFKQNTTNASGQIVGGNNYRIDQKDLNFVKAHSELEFGFSWGTYSFCNKWYIDLSASYTFQVFFDQNMFRKFWDDQSIGATLAPTGNLYIQGMNIAARLDF